MAVLFPKGCTMRKDSLGPNAKFLSKMIGIAVVAISLLTSQNLQAQVPDLFNPPVPDIPGFDDGLRNFITPSDSSTFVRSYYDEFTTYWHSNDSGQWEQQDVWMFQIDLGHTTIKAPIRANGEYTAQEVYFWLNTFGKILGQLPRFMLSELDAIYFLRDGGGLIANPSGGVMVRTEYLDGLRARFQHGWIEELMVHELAHASLQLDVLGHESIYQGQLTNWWDYFAALDNDFVTDYAMTNRAEDFADTFTLWLFNKFRSYRDVQGSAANRIAKVPYRVLLLEDLNTRFNWNASW
jgi:hypothetical protein